VGPAGVRPGLVVRAPTLNFAPASLSTSWLMSAHRREFPETAHNKGPL